MNQDSISGDQAKVSVLVQVHVEDAFRLFTEEIDQWWRRGLKYRIAGKRRGIICIEPRLGGRLFESFETPRGQRVVETGRVTAWEPPTRLVLEWRPVNFSAAERTEVEVSFDRQQSGTLVTVTHRGWNQIRTDHPARHGLAQAPFLRMMGLWWGGLMQALREHASQKASTEEPGSSCGNVGVG